MRITRWRQKTLGLFHEILGQRLSQQRSRPIQPRLDCLGRAAGGDSGFSKRKVFVFAEDHRRFERFGQGIDRGANCIRGFRANQIGVWSN